MTVIPDHLRSHDPGAFLPKPAGSEQGERVKAVLASFESALVLINLRQLDQAERALGRAKGLLSRLDLPAHSRAKRVLTDLLQLIVAARNPRDLGRALRAFERAKGLQP